MKYLIFGTGEYYNRYKKWFEKDEILALLDNSRQKQHTLIDGIEVLPPEDGVRLKYDAVVILSFYVKQMKEQLISLGVGEEKIWHFYGLRRLFGKNRAMMPVRYFANAEEIIGTAGHKVLLMSNDLLLGGPAIALFHAAMFLKRHGYSVVCSSMLDGPMRERMAENDIPVIVDENLQLSTMDETEWAGRFSLIICNTLNFHIFLSERDTSIPIIWWLHDARFFYDGADREAMGKISMRNLTAVSVGPIPAAAAQEFLPGMECGELLYGVDDESGIGDGKKNDAGAVRFITIGFVEERKGQHILMQAVKMLPDEIIGNSEFLIVGHDDTMLGGRIKKESLGMGMVRVMGSVGREEIHGLLGSSHVLICPSIQDPMPTVAAEAMMHFVPCILSDATGTAAYIHDGEDGFVFPCGDAAALAEKIIWCVKNRDRLEDMGKKARKIYEKYFSMEAFEERFLEVLDIAGEGGHGLCQN